MSLPGCDVLRGEMMASIQIGYWVEEGTLEERGIRTEMPDAEIEWLASWLIGEGWTKE